MADDKPLNAAEADNAIQAAIDALGTARGATPEVDTALATAKKVLALISLGLIATGFKPKPEP